MMSPSLERLLTEPPYAIAQSEKRRLLCERLSELTRHHYEHCEAYRNIVDRLFGGLRALEFDELEAAPFIPVSLFKTQELRSVAAPAIVKTLTSSGTTGQAVSRIYLDAATSQLQTRVLVRIMQHFLGAERRPMVFLDHAGVIRDRRSSSARAAGILGLMPFGRQPFFALREDMSLDLEGLQAYLNRAGERPPVLFGFTFMVWQHFARELERLGVRLSLPGATLLHSGGWKKLEALRVGPDELRETLRKLAGIETVINYYGMVEQVGSVYLENPLGFLQASNFSDVIIRDTNTLEPLPAGRRGLIQVVSALPSSYPGQSILTEDMGTVQGCDDPAAGMLGQYFSLHGRLPKAELRGCSDTFQKSAAAA